MRAVENFSKKNSKSYNAEKKFVDNKLHILLLEIWKKNK